MSQITPRVSMFPKMVEEFARENLSLKALSAVLLTLSFVSLCLVVYLIRRGPTVIALDYSGEVARVETKVTDLQIEASIRQYLSYRYAWAPQTIDAQLAKAELFIAPESVKAFQKAMLDVEKFVRDKKVVQRLYPRSIEVDLNEKKVTILADRINEFDQLKAASEMRLILHFAVSDRTVTNPWGIYITREVEGGAN